MLEFEKRVCWVSGRGLAPGGPPMSAVVVDESEVRTPEHRVQSKKWRGMCEARVLL